MKKKKKTFREMYLEEKSKPTAAAQFIATVAQQFKRDETTVRLWISGAQQPNKDLVPAIEKYFGQDIATLFPNANYDKK